MTEEQRAVALAISFLEGRGITRGAQQSPLRFDAPAVTGLGPWRTVWFGEELPPPEGEPEGAAVRVDLQSATCAEEPLERE